MNAPAGQDRLRDLLPNLPVGARVMLTAFLVIVGAGYLSAVANIYHTHQMADGREGLSIDDVRAVYAGLQVTRTDDAILPSRMLTMIHGAMRQYIDREDDFEILETWLKDGGVLTGLDEGPRRKTPRRALIRNCLRCHARSTGTDISKKSPFGPNELEVDPQMIAGFVAAGAESTDEVVDLPPQYDLPRLVLISHVHMLAIPLFTLIVAVLFMMTRLPTAWRTVLTPAPMLAMVCDFSGWWLARFAGGFVYVILAAGAVFGLAFGFQVIVVLIDLWRPAAGNR